MRNFKVSSAAFALAVSALALEAREGHGAEYYVSPIGSDGAVGSLAAPFRTISRGVAAAMPGDTVYIRGGRYVGWANQLNPIRAGRADAWITFRAFEGELPVLIPPAGATEASAFEPFDDPADSFADAPISFIRVEGLVAYQWPTSGFSNGWEKHANNIEVRHCIADGNGINGLTFYDATGVVFEHNIAAHNGNRAPSYSSGVNLYRVSGGAGVNIVRGNVSFENIDICGDTGAHPCDASRSTDGSGFILDEGGTGVRFESNLAFRNGGSCLRMTLTPGAQLVNNTCYNNGLDTGYEFAFGEIFFSDQGSRNDIVVRNNIAVGTNGQAVVNNTNGTNANVGNNAFAPTTAAVFRDPDGTKPDFRLSPSGQSLVDTADRTATGPSDLGFDPGCIVRASAPIQGVSFWQYAVNYSYIQSIGGVAACFRTAARAIGANPDMGAYESTAGAGCQFHSDCDDADRCSRDVCSDAGQCSSSAIAGCCEADADCQDASACTTNSCNTATNRCETTPVPACCSSAADCDDGNACTSDACDAAGNCSNSDSAACANAGGPMPPVVTIPVTNPATDTTPAAGTGGQAAAAGAAGAPAAAGAGGMTPVAGGAGGAGAATAPVTEPALTPASQRGSGGCSLGLASSSTPAALIGLLALGALAARRRRWAALAAALATLGCGDDGPSDTANVPMFPAMGTSTTPPGNDPTAPGSVLNPPSATGGTTSVNPSEGQPNPALPLGMGGTSQTAPPLPDPATDPPSGPAQACAGTPAAEDGLVIDFGTYDLASGAWGNDVSAQLTGGTSPYSCADDGSCPASAALAFSKTEAGSMRLAATLPAGGYTGAVFWFGPCVNASAFEGIQFLASGSLGGGQLLFKVQTNANYPVDVANQKGACQYPRESTKWSDCLPPMVTLSTLGAEPVLFSLPWGAFAGGKPSASVTPEDLVGLEVQFQCTSGSACTVDAALGTMLLQSPPFTF